MSDIQFFREELVAHFIIELQNAPHPEVKELANLLQPYADDPVILFYTLFEKINKNHVEMLSPYLAEALKISVSLMGNIYIEDCYGAHVFNKFISEEPQLEAFRITKYNTLNLTITYQNLNTSVEVIFNLLDFHLDCYVDEVLDTIESFLLNSIHQLHVPVRSCDHVSTSHSIQRDI